MNHLCRIRPFYGYRGAGLAQWLKPYAHESKAVGSILLSGVWAAIAYLRNNNHPTHWHWQMNWAGSQYLISYKRHKNRCARTFRSRLDFWICASFRRNAGCILYLFSSFYDILFKALLDVFGNFTHCFCVLSSSWNEIRRVVLRPIGPNSSSAL